MTSYDVDVNIDLFVLESSISSEKDGSVPCRFTYSIEDALAVKLIFEKYNQWVFARALLMEGVDSSTGTGDVEISPIFYKDAECVRISLSSSSPAGKAILLALKSDVKNFLEKTKEYVPEGQENTYINMAINNFLGI